MTPADFQAFRGRVRILWSRYHQTEDVETRGGIFRDMLNEMNKAGIVGYSSASTPDPLGRTTECTLRYFTQRGVLRQAYGHGSDESAAMIDALERLGEESGLGKVCHNECLSSLWFLRETTDKSMADILAQQQRLLIQLNSLQSAFGESMKHLERLLRNE